MTTLMLAAAVAAALLGMIPTDARASSSMQGVTSAVEVTDPQGSATTDLLGRATGPIDTGSVAPAISVGPGRAGVIVRRSNTTLSGYTITGPQAKVFNGREIGILVAGTASSPLENIVIRNCTISRFGYAAIVLRYVRSFKIENCVIRDAVYAGILVVSSRNGFIRYNRINRIGVVGYQTAGMNSYGIALTDEGGAMSANIKVLSNKIQDVPQWHGIDTHGGNDIVIAYNTVRGANRGIFITTTTRGRGALRMTISGNWLADPSRRVDVRTRYPYNQVGITIYGAKTVTGTRNTFDGWPRGNHIDVSGGSTGVRFTYSRIYHPT